MASYTLWTSNWITYYCDPCHCKSQFTSLVGALTGAGQPDFVTILSGTGPFTVFAPTNDAFTALNTELALEELRVFLVQI